ncbi:hypothetical protein ACU8KH_01630 [Lachancea thermotolerans]
MRWFCRNQAFSSRAWLEICVRVVETTKTGKSYLVLGLARPLQKRGTRFILAQNLLYLSSLSRAFHELQHTESRTTRRIHRMGSPRNTKFVITLAVCFTRSESENFKERY